MPKLLRKNDLCILSHERTVAYKKTHTQKPTSIFCFPLLTSIYDLLWSDTTGNSLAEKTKYVSRVIIWHNCTSIVSTNQRPYCITMIVYTYLLIINWKYINTVNTLTDFHYSYYNLLFYIKLNQYIYTGILTLAI